MDRFEQLKRAIDSDNLDLVKALMTADPELHHAPLGYGGGGPLTWVAECRVPWQPPGPARLQMARWMIANGSDVHQGGDAPLMRAALNADRIPMMDLLVSLGADVNASWNGNFPILFAPCEAVAPASLQWLLVHGADPNCTGSGAGTTALDYLIAGYVRAPGRLAECIEILLAAGGATQYSHPAFLAILRGRLDLLEEQLDANPALLGQTFPDLNVGATGGRLLTLRGATLLHVAAEYGNLPAAELLVRRGLHVNARAAIDATGTGGQTAIFHAVTQLNESGLPLAEFLIGQGADLTIRARVPGHYERPGETVDCSAPEYARLFAEPAGATVRLLQRSGAAG